jgi:hypothetical protein
MANFTRDGYGQVEPNQLSAQKTGQIYARLPLDQEVSVLQNGEFMYYDYGNGTVNSGKTNTGATDPTITTAGEPMLVFNEIKLYEPFWRTSYKDFAMIRKGDNYVTSGPATNGPGVGPTYGDGSLTTGVEANPPHTEYNYRMAGFAPRLFKTNIGDIFTTNMVKVGVEYKVGDILSPVKNNDTKTLQLEKSSDGDMKWMVVQVYTMPDGQPGLKLQRVA